MIYEIIKSLNKFNDDQLARLLSLKYKDQSSLITSNLEDMPYIYEYIQTYDLYEFEKLYVETLIILETKPRTNFKEFMRYLSIFHSAKRQLEIDIENFRNKVEVVDGAYVCSNCSSSKTISSSALRASADEASTLFIVCYACGHKWHIKG